MEGEKIKQTSFSITTNSPEETLNYGFQLGQKFISKGGVIFLEGELGAGKTTFVQGFAKGLGVSERIISPTFVLMRQHQIPHTQRLLVHVDLYRIENTVDEKIMGLNEFYNLDNVVLIEWADKIDHTIAINPIVIKITKRNESSREITIDGSI